MNVKEPGRHADGGNLYLNVTKSGARSWVFLYKLAGRQREMGLGSALDVNLAKARVLAEAARGELREGRDPLAARAKVAAVPTFGEVADAYVEAKRPEWTNPKHADQWAMTLTKHAAAIRPKRVDQVETGDILGLLETIWLETPETASRLRGRIEKVLDAAKAKGHRAGENPARWRGHLDQLLPKASKLSRGHHAAMSIDDLPAFLGRIRLREGLSARALEFTILNATRTTETLTVEWSEVDFDKALWVIPKEKTKTKKEHRVPLSSGALAVLEPLRQAASGNYVFPGMKPGRPLSNMSMDKILRLEEQDITVHGFRSTFKDWATERTKYPNEMSEVALAHGITNKVEAAYRRGDMMEKRRGMMEAWARFCRGEVTACS